MRRWFIVLAMAVAVLAGSVSSNAQSGQSSVSEKGDSSTDQQTTDQRGEATLTNRTGLNRGIVVADKGVAPKVAAPGATVPLARIQPARVREVSVADFIPDEVFVVGAIQPARMMNAKLFREAISRAGADDVVDDMIAQATKQFVLNPTKVDEITVFIDQEMLSKYRSGLTGSQRRIRAVNNLKQLGLAMLNFHDVHNSFPDADGFQDSKGNLSWRVHLLPYLGDVELYEKFRLDEPWDSENNKPLIQEMPEVFRVTGVEEQGKTSIHVLTGPGTPFGSEESVSFRQVTDGTSNTILMIAAGADTAEEWTKPGGLEIDPEAPLKALGTLEDKILVGFMDGSVTGLDAEMDPETFLHAAQHQDGYAIDIPYESLQPSMPTPGMIIRYAEEIDQQAFINEISPESIEIDGRPAFRLDSYVSILFADRKTILWSSEDTLKLMLAKRGNPGEVKEEFLKLYPANDGVAVSRLDLEDDEIKEFFPGTPFMGMLQSLVKATAVVDATGDNKSFLQVTVETENAQSAQQIQGVLNGGFQIFKGQMLSEISREGSGVPEDVVEVLSELVESVTIETEQSAVAIQIPKVNDSGKLMTDLEPAIKELAEGIRAGRARAKEFEKLNSIRQIGLAMFNYHDVYSGFPSWNTPQGNKENRGLSWRVYLLPFLEETELYNQFHLDEPWDSEHNKALIEKMPKVYQTAGVEEPGKTSLHVFLGDSTPFGGDEPRGIVDITDGTSNTLMVVQAGSDKADFWTKPSGLEYDPEDPKACLGNIGEKMMILMGDGSARFMEADIDDVTLRRMIEHQDGEPLGNF
ncbi:MAG: DUF1559 domain-containing protein [Planctomycetota bacterium]